MHEQLVADETRLSKSRSNNRSVEDSHDINPKDTSYVISAHDSSIGKVRENMEDKWYLNKEIGLFIIADGMGGHEGGEIASSIAVDEVSKFLKEKLVCTTFHNGEEEERTLKKIFKDALKAANQKIVEESKNNADIRGMGTTIVFSFIPKNNANRLYVVNVGDSRAYKIKGENHTVVRGAGREEGEGIITQLTEDHSVTAEMVRKGLISEQEARTHELKHTLTQSLGRPFDHKAFIKRIEWEKDDYLLLCSDGLTDMLEDKEICSTVLEYQTHEREEVANSNKQKDNVKQVVTEQTKDVDALIHPLEKTCDALVKKANEKGGRDNITVVLVQNKYHDPNKNTRTKSKDNKKRQDIPRM